MKQKRKVGFFLGLILIVSMLVAVGGAPTVSKAVTTTTLSLQDQVTSLQNQILIQKLLALIAQLQAQLQQIIATKANPTIQCGWCGNSCINWTGKDRSSTVCADVMPPANSYCQNINGTCQITNSNTKYSCSTAMGTISDNNYTGCIPDSNGTFNSLAECQNSCPVTTTCITEGNSISVTPIGFTQSCCSGLTLCRPPAGVLGIRGTCQKTCATTIRPVVDLKVNGSDGPINAPYNSILNISWSSNKAVTCNSFGTNLALTNGSSWVVHTQSNSGILALNGTAQAYTRAYDATTGPLNGTLVLGVQCWDGTRQLDGQDMVTINVTAAPTCSDSDGGRNFYVKGTTTGMDSNNVLTTDTDYCSGNNLVEWFCSGAYRTNTNYICPNGCENGVCKPATVVTTTPASTITCTDTDGGDSRYQKGTITIKTAAGGQWNYTDSCQGSNMVQEYSCLANPSTYPDSNAVSAYMLSYLTCGVGETCYDGACKIMGSYLKSPCGNYGDTDLDGYVTSSDTEIVANYQIMLSRLSSDQKLRADVNGDGVVDSLDTLLMSRYVAKLDTTFPVCTPKTVSGCSWCGNQCVLSSTLVGIQCATVMPPTGSICALVNGVCTISNGGVVEGVETHIFSENLGYGMENDDVRILQSLLAQKGYFSGIVSGYFGWQTEEAVKAFQTANNISATGLVGPLTRELLNK